MFRLEFEHKCQTLWSGGFETITKQIYEANSIFFLFFKMNRKLAILKQWYND